MVPDFFVVTTAATETLIDRAGVRKLLLKKLKNQLDHKNLSSIAKETKGAVLAASWPKSVQNDIHEAYLVFERTGQSRSLVVRTSTVWEYQHGQVLDNHEQPYLNIKNFSELNRAIKASVAGAWSSDNLYHYLLHGQKAHQIQLAVIVQQMVEPVVAGGLTTTDPVGQSQDTIIIEAGWGLGIATSAGEITPDRYELDKSTWQITNQIISQQAWAVKLVNGQLKHQKVPKDKQNVAKLTADQLLELGRLARQAENFFGYPQDLEWAIEGDKLWFLHARPVRIGPRLGDVHDIKSPGAIGEVIVYGMPGSIGLATGLAKIIDDPKDSADFPPNAILVTELTTPSFAPIIQQAAGVVTNTGGATSHAALIAREFGVPCVVGATNATILIPDGQLITIDGVQGRVYKGKVQPQDLVEQHRLTPSDKRLRNDWVTGTKIYVNIASVDQARQAAQLPVDGVGLVRSEFLIAESGEHPLSLVAQGRGQELRDQIVQKLSEITRAFYPRPVVYRTADFKTNEYRQLKDGEQYEQLEQNPALGYRGAARYLVEPTLFNLELEAMGIVRQQHGLTNLWLVIPFVRTLVEFKQVLTMIKSAGLPPNRNFKIWLMVETPGNVWSMADYCQFSIQGISIGSNDLTQLILGVDRDNSRLSTYFDERDPAVVAAMKQVIKVARQHHLTSSICGNGVSIHPDLVAELVAAGITSVSVVPDKVEETRRLVASVERRILLEKALEL